MVYITSRKFVLPKSPEEMAGQQWFNLWTKRLWPYCEIAMGDILYWYESPSHSIIWKSRVRRVEQFKYTSKAQVAQRLKSISGAFDEQDEYFKEGPHQGYCLAYSIEPLERLGLPRPEGFRFAQIGWMRFQAVRNQWPELGH